MRVIAGKARHIQLAAPQGMSTRPTTDRIKETLFNILQGELYNCSFLDLFAGSGGIGIEALSRGAAVAVFADNSTEALKCIDSNLEKTHLKEQAEVLAMDCVNAVDHLSRNNRQFDIIFMDPPYNTGAEYEVLKALEHSSLVTDNTLVIIEESLEVQLDGIEDMGFVIERVKKYKTNQHFFIRKSGR